MAASFSPGARPCTLTAVHVLLLGKRRMGEELGWELQLDRGEAANNVKGNKILSENWKDTEKNTEWR